ncbi:MAG: bifunctional isocitrate dehydrogenase kinase/phosphatase [SAR324 cluster bacterium]|nr:bifunctional isocitrate dehydrogenase kinase/phosphatase [SAR324 cluster bacterium]
MTKLENSHFKGLIEKASDSKKIELLAQWALCEFDLFYSRFQVITESAKTAFETRDYQASLIISKKRLSLYSDSMYKLGENLSDAFSPISRDQGLWEVIEEKYRQLVRNRYEGDLALAYIHSVRRALLLGEWSPVDYSFDVPSKANKNYSDFLFETFHTEAITTDLLLDILRVPGFNVQYRELKVDAMLAAQRVKGDLDDRFSTYKIQKIEVIKGEFYRNRGAYIVGRIVLDNLSNVPLVIALLNEEKGIYVDAILTSESAAFNIFSTTRANFHVNNEYYHELSEFLHSIIPKRTLGLSYSTIGFNHFGKVAVMEELKEELLSNDGKFDFAIGFKGTVAIGFQSRQSGYNLKVIRNSPTEQYKWGMFEGVPSVLEKYSRVHVINRTGSMLDNIIFYRVKLERIWFTSALLEELLNEASECVTLQGNFLFFRHLIVQRRLTPLPVYLETSSQAESEAAVINLGHCIKNNMAANIFNKDLDARNYGVGVFGGVYLFDYDALEKFTEVKIRTNQNQFEGEEEIPEWFFEDGVVFLPEEIESGLRIPSRSLRRLFREVHGDLLQVDYYEKIQNELRVGKVPSVRVYPERYQIKKKV